MDSNFPTGVPGSPLSLCLVLAASLTGCWQRSPPANTTEMKPAPRDVTAEIRLPQVVAKSPLKVDEETLFSYRPEIQMQNEKALNLEFAANGEMPEGATLDPETGELNWTPTETQGPGLYLFSIRYWSTINPKKKSSFSYKVEVAERNSAPNIEMPVMVTVDAGKVVEFPIRISDRDFPSNQVEIDIINGPQQGMNFDAISGLLRWHVPSDWQQSRLIVKVSAIDDGKPRLQSHRAVTINVRKRAQVTRNRSKQEDAYRSPHAYIELPELPRPGEQSVPVRIPIPSFNKIKTENRNPLRLSLLVPDEVKERFAIKYSDGEFNYFTITTTEPFEAEPQDIELPKQAIAECKLDGAELKWMWAVTKNLRVRGLQNNIRECVVSIEDERGEALHLVALQPIHNVTGLSVLALLGADKLKKRLIRKPRTTVVSPLVANHLRLVTQAGGSIPGKSHLDDNWLVTSFVDHEVAPDVLNFEFRVFSYRDEVAVYFDSEPSIARAKEVAVTAKRIFSASKSNYNRWNRKLGSARRAYVNAQQIAVSSNAERVLKTTKLNQALANINNCSAKLTHLAVEIPRKQALVTTNAAKLQKVTNALAPLKTHVLCGELCRIVSDVRIVVVKLNVPLPPKRFRAGVLP